VPSLDTVFWYALVSCSLLNTLTSIMYFRAIKLSPLSITVPMLTFTPLFMLLTSPLIVGEFPGLLGIGGIVLIVIGAYIIHIRNVRDGLLSPFRRLAGEQGPLLMLGVAFIWSITSNLDKVAVLHSSPLFYIVLFNALVALFLTPLAYLKTRGRFKGVRVSVKVLVPLGLFTALTAVFQMTALTLTLAAYVISIKRLSAIFAIIYGFAFFREKNIRQCLLGAAIMLAGALLITMF
jgi:drug/metabolite transporter (DMT)-like permease